MLKQKIMAVGAHADDIEVMAGGTLLKYKTQGYEIIYVMATNNMSGGNCSLNNDGTISKTQENPVKTMERRKKECDIAAAVLGTKPVHLDHPQRHYYDDGSRPELRYGCKLPEGVSENVPSILTAYEDKASIQKLVELIIEQNPACIITHGMASSNIEHYATALLVVKSFWLAVEKGFRGALIQAREDYTAYGDINVKWDTFIDISDYLDDKMELLGKHKSQMPTAHYPDHGHRLRNLKWGVACGCKATEVFTWVRHYDRPNLDACENFYSPFILELIKNTKY